MSGMNQFWELVEGASGAAALVKLVLGKYRGREPGLRNLVVRPVTLRGQACLSLVYRYETKDITKNYPMAEGMGMLRGLLGGDFKSGHLFSRTGDAQVEISKKGSAAFSVTKPTRVDAPDQRHDRAKERLIDPSRPFLAALGVTQKNGQVLPSMSRKWKQINVFLDLFRGALMASRIDREKPVCVVDFGSGKGYLTFAVYDYLTQSLGLSARVTGVEIREDLVKFCREAAASLEMDGLTFEPGDLKSHAPAPVQVMIALHACDMATDLAIHKGVQAGAEIIMCAPCCHKEIRPQMVSPPVLLPLLRFGVHLGQEAEMVTDTLRALLLEASGYDVQVFEFISLEHTNKNKMILAVKRARAGNPAQAQQQIAALKEFYGIQTFALERF